MDFLDFAFLCATLKVDSARCTCRMDMVDSAFESLWSNLYDHVMFGSYGQLEYSLRIEISMGWMKKLKNRYFLILSFCFHEATLEADLGR